MNFIDDFLNNITMYRLVLYYLILLLLSSLILSFFKILPFSPLSLIFSVLFITGVCWVTNKIFAKTFEAPTNVESIYISALILSLIITPIKSFHDIPFLFWAGVLTMSSKYILAFNKKHFFNPVAIAVTLTSFAIGGSASWWIGTLSMLPFVMPGILIVKKIRKFNLLFYFLITALIVITGFSFLNGNNPFVTITKSIFYSPLLFFAFVMLTEPLTTPSTKSSQSIYAGFVGFLFAPQIHIGSFFTTPEIASVLGNIFSYLVSSKVKLILSLKEKIQIAPDICDFIFGSNQKLSFLSGQYMEWTLSHNNPDSRGNRRYFTLSSSPTEEDIRIGIKFYNQASSFKKFLNHMEKGNKIIASQLAGDFVLPKDPNKKLVFIAGGIGITPFRSMLKYLLDTNQKRPIILFYANKIISEIVYEDILKQAEQSLGVKTIYILTDTEQIPYSWQGKRGRITEQMIAEEVPDYKERMFYLSGPHAMVTGFDRVLKNMGVDKIRIKTDYFPGFV